MKNTMNKTQKLIFGTVYGFIFSLPTTGSVFMQYIAPIILKENKNPTISIGIAIIAMLVSLASIWGLFAVGKNIERTYQLKSSDEFYSYLVGLVIALVIALLSALLIRKAIFGY